jgi:ribose transport system substrate-binding protein
MKLAYKISVFGVIALVALSAAGSLYFFSRVNSVYNKTNSYMFSDAPKYHFSMILKSGDDTYWQDFKEGAFEAGKVYNAAIEFNPVPDTDSNEETVKYINIAYESKLDGIVMAAENTSESAEAINQAAQGDMNIVVGVVENVNNDRLAYVGTNFYEYGVQAAKLISQAAGDKAKVNLAVILSSENSQQSNNATTTPNDVMLNGLNSALKNEGRINLKTALNRNSDLLGAEDMTRKILTEYPDIDVIFCTNAKDTVAAAHVIIERNLVGRVAIVGTDVTTEVTNYIKKKIIFGVLDRNGYSAGYQSIGLLSNSMGHTFQTNYVDININAYTQVNIATYNRSNAL